MSKKNVEDYLTEGVYGTPEIKRSERKQFLGTIRERVVVALTKGQVMSDKGLIRLGEEMQNNKGAKLLINGHVSSKFLKQEKELAKKYNIPYTVVTNNEADTDIGAVLTYDHAIDKEEIFVKDIPEKKQKTKPENLLTKIKNLIT
ncbi:YueI family protein [Virgibacillus kekensis]|uniref:YueI family protein n=1 Tax=Virgibacillus kekensis TaxID=202261 RepID=A0ABV9DMX0_9BACI